MTIGIDSQNLESFVPVYDAIPESWDQARPFIVEQLRKISDGVNIREIGWYLDQELLSGKAFIPGVNNETGGTSQQFRQILRIVIDFGTLPNNTSKTVPHGITVDDNFTLIQMYAAATDPINLISFPIPFAATSTGAVQMFMNATDILISTNTDRTSFTRCFVVIEYLQEL